MNATPLRYTLDEATCLEVRAEIARARITLLSVSKKSGLNRTALSRKTNALSSFSVGELGAVAKALGTTAADLVARAEAATALADKETAR